jgi:Skp family chaperone for outer membrane proteins
VANEETGFGTIKCPGCGEAIPISEAIHHQIAERTRQEFKAEALEARRLLAARERELDEKMSAFDQTVSDRLAAERAKLSREIEAQLSPDFQRKLQTLSGRQTREASGLHRPKQSSLNSEPRSET